MDLFRWATPATYWLLVGMWTFILYFYIKRISSKKIKSRLILILITILAIDAFRTLFESAYFGAWYTSLAGLLPANVHDFLVRPEIVIVPKLLNVIAAALIIAILLRRWLPQETLEREHLESLVKERTAELAKANEQLRRLAEEVAHHVLNSATSIGGFTSFLQKRPPGDAAAQDSLKIILSEVQKLERMVSDIHRHTSVPHPEFNLISLPAVLERVLSEASQGFESQGTQVKQRFSTKTPEVSADGKLIELALTNILTNAREAMPKGGDLEVSVAPEGPGVCITVKDTGVGIEPKDIPSVFDPLYSTKPEASGLGLTTAHQIISAHKGEIRIISSPGKGTEVRIWLAVTQEPVDSWDAGSSAALH